MNKVEEDIKNVVESVLNLLKVDFSLEITREGGQTKVYITTDQPQIFLDDETEMLRALQHFSRVAVQLLNKGDRTHFILDVNGYKKERELGIQKLIPKVADRALLSGKTLILINLTSYERLLVHAGLKGVDGVETRSVGLGKGRKLIVSPTSEIGSVGIEESEILDLNKLID
jgi:spoIIIJ-associated protein